MRPLSMTKCIEMALVLKKVLNFYFSILNLTFSQMNNFEGMASVVSVFGNAAIQRLKPLWNSLPSKVISHFCIGSLFWFTFSMEVVKKCQKLQQLLLPVRNYKEYVTLVSSRSPPMLPWIAPKLRELRFLYDGNRKFKEDGSIDYEFLMVSHSFVWFPYPLVELLLFLVFRKNHQRISHI